MILSFGVVLLLLLMPYLPETNRTDPSHQLVLYIFRGGTSNNMIGIFCFAICFFFLIISQVREQNFLLATMMFI
jgi:hypothetical protein